LDILRHLGRINQSISLAGMDSSDGLGDAIIQICQCSGVGATLEYSAIPISPALQKLVNSEQALNWALYGGEDFELVLCLAPEIAENLIAAIDVPAAIIGKITSEKVVKIINCPGINSEISLSLREGFQHF
jgi:thiamine-monophosphate kinase